MFFGSMIFKIRAEVEAKGRSDSGSAKKMLESETPFQYLELLKNFKTKCSLMCISSGSLRIQERKCCSTSKL